jgi:hypothetical protein
LATPASGVEFTTPQVVDAEYRIGNIGAHSKQIEIGMIQDIEKFAAQLQVHSLREFPSFGNRHVQIGIGRSSEDIPAHVPKGTSRPSETSVSRAPSIRGIVGAVGANHAIVD